jgi:hypothetical protein
MSLTYENLMFERWSYLSYQFQWMKDFGSIDNWGTQKDYLIDKIHTWQLWAFMIFTTLQS